MRNLKTTVPVRANCVSRVKRSWHAAHVDRIPEKMKAVAVDTFGTPGVLSLHTVPVPEPGLPKYLSRCELPAWTYGMCPCGMPPGRPGGKVKFPLIPGTDGAAFIVAKGNRVRNVRITPNTRRWIPSTWDECRKIWTIRKRVHWVRLV